MIYKVYNYASVEEVLVESKYAQPCTKTILGQYDALLNKEGIEFDMEHF